MWFSINITKSTGSELEDRLRNPFWWSFLLAWGTWNWKVWYVTFFMSEDISWNKIEYIKNMYSYFDFYSLFPLIGFLVNWLMIPLILSWVLVFILTEILVHKFLNKKYDLEDKELIIKNNYFNKKKKILKKEEEVLNKEQEINTKKEEVKNKLWKEEIKEWERDYKKVNKRFLEWLSDFIFNNWWINNYSTQSSMNISDKWLSTFIRRLYSYELIENTNESTYHLTKKWKYFMKKLTENE